jgi:DNA-directed RNA polymerase subunit RPC12/RpoP
MTFEKRQDLYDYEYPCQWCGKQNDGFVRKLVDVSRYTDIVDETAYLCPDCYEAWKKEQDAK